MERRWKRERRSAGERRGVPVGALARALFAVGAAEVVLACVARA